MQGIRSIQLGNEGIDKRKREEQVEDRPIWKDKREENEGKEIRGFQVCVRVPAPTNLRTLKKWAANKK